MARLLVLDALLSVHVPLAARLLRTIPSVGLVPSQDQPGDKNRWGDITRQGSPVVRLDLTEAVSQACRLLATRPLFQQAANGQGQPFLEIVQFS